MQAIFIFHSIYTVCKVFEPNLPKQSRNVDGSIYKLIVIGELSPVAMCNLWVVKINNMIASLATSFHLASSICRHGSIRDTVDPPGFVEFFRKLFSHMLAVKLKIKQYARNNAHEEISVRKVVWMFLFFISVCCQLEVKVSCTVRVFLRSPSLHRRPPYTQSTFVIRLNIIYEWSRLNEHILSPWTCSTLRTDTQWFWLCAACILCGVNAISNFNVVFKLDERSLLFSWDFVLMETWNLLYNLSMIFGIVKSCGKQDQCDTERSRRANRICFVSYLQNLIRLFASAQRPTKSMKANKANNNNVKFDSNSHSGSSANSSEQ